MPQYNKDSDNSDQYEEYSAPLGSLNISGTSSESRVWIKNKVSPLVMARTLKQMITEINDTGGRLSAKGMPAIEYDIMGSGSIMLRLHFHEKMIENNFIFRSEYNGDIPVAPDVTDATELGGPVGELSNLLEDAFNASFEFAELDGASIGIGGRIVDFEFKYDGFANRKKIENTDPGEHV